MARRALHLLILAACLSGCPSVEKVPSKSDILYFDAYARLNENDYAASIGILSEIIAADAAYTDAYVLRAYAREQTNDPSAARDDLLSAQLMQPDNFVIHYNLGNVYFQLKDHEKAVEQFTIALSLNGKHSYSYLNRACSYVSLKRWKDALADYRAYLALSEEQADAVRSIVSKLEEYAKAAK